MKMISPEAWIGSSLEEGEQKGSHRPLLDVKKAKASLLHSPVEGLLLRLLEHVSINEGLCLAGEIFDIFHPGINYIASII